ncbi:flavin reductase family protein [Martelella sp. HB161492]|uniref:flavin reductase family protein n=1 Tax=Martelella sp. HB161492 TaxID=2720726 RepID=UPI0015908CA2|nr:flavin reductase family protein [Martelella sp. HB161492]
MTTGDTVAEAIGIADFKRAMRSLPAQVAIIASRSAGTRIAMTATAVTSLSAEPPQLLVCIHRMARPAAVIEAAGAFSVNLASVGQADVATQCALPGLEPDERFERGCWTASPYLAQPLLEGALVGFECELVSKTEHGTHFVFVGLIRHVRFSDGEPLLYHDGSYREIGRRLDWRDHEWDNIGLAF